MSNLLSQASLVMIPSGYKEDVVYSQIPTSGAGDLSFTRASNGTRINSAGLIEVCPWNLLQQSETFDNAFWGKTNLSVSANSTTAPNGTTTADTLTTTAIGQCQLITYFDFLVGNYTLSFYVKKVDLGFTYVELGNAYCWVNLTTGAITGASQFGSGWTFVSANASSVGDGWLKVEMVASCSIAGTYGVRPLQPVASSGGYDSLATNKATYLWGAQLNIGSTAKPYFPTTDRLNVPRLTYQNGGGGCPSLLLEKQSTNLLTYSEQYDNAAWNKIQISATANNTTSPDGTQNADLITTTATGVCYTYELIAGTNGAYSASVYAKNGNNNYLALNIQNSVNNWVTSVFDLSDGSLGEYAQGSGGGIVYVNHTITPVGNGWYRCVLNYTTNQNSYYCPMFAPLKTGNSFTSAYGEAQSNANNKTIYLWGAQLEASSYPTSYIPTTSSSATRVADACLKSGISSLIGQNEGVVFIDINRNYITSSYDRYFAVDDADASIYRTGIFILPEPTIDGRVYVELRNNNTGVFAYTYNSTTIPRLKIAVAYKNNDMAIYINGTQMATSSASLTFAHTLSGVLSSGNGQSINEAILFPTRLTNAELQALTTL